MTAGRVGTGSGVVACVRALALAVLCAVPAAAQAQTGGAEATAESPAKQPGRLPSAEPETATQPPGAPPPEPQTPAADGAGAPAACAKSEFETVVDEAAAALRDLNQQNKPRFQDKLRQLKEKRGWSQDDFMKEGAPFVKDEKIEGFDTASNDLLARISSMGEEGSAAKVPDCAMLMQLRAHMNVLVETQNAKWAYMFGKIDAELVK